MAKVKRKTTAQQKKTPIGLILVGAASVIVILLVVLLSINQSRSSSVTSVDVSKYSELPDGWIQRATLGNPDAAVTIQMWEDFLCPACRQWTEQLEPELYREYVLPGKVKLEYHQFPLSIHDPGSTLAANASECAADQGGFWPYHDRLFQVAGEQGASGFTIDKLQQYADEVGLDGDALGQCMSSQKHWDEVRASVNQAIGMGLNSTPSILVNGQLAANPFDLNNITGQIDSLLAASGQ
jgi:protein-disulfide isomerase